MVALWLGARGLRREPRPFGRLLNADHAHVILSRRRHRCPRDDAIGEAIAEGYRRIHPDARRVGDLRRSATSGP
jgi:hypothetical protein